MNRTWQALFTRYGFTITEVAGLIDLHELTEHNRNLLEKLLNNLNVNFTVEGCYLKVHSTEITESQWVEQLKTVVDGRTEMSFHPTEIPIDKLDVYIAGVVMQLNRLGYTMGYSCDGHENRRPTIYFETADFARLAKSVLASVGTSARRQGRKLTFTAERNMLPAVAEELSAISLQKVCLQDDELIAIEVFETELETVLNIAGASGNEGEIRNHVMRELEPLVDYMTVDHVGNILAEKRFGPGPTVLLNAHLDTVEEIIKHREIVKNGQLWMSNEGILGVDDRAGVNIVLSAAKSVGKSTFRGTVKYIFTVEEEIGLRGAREVTKSFLWDVAMAFVIDRRGTSDIVTSRGGEDSFCTPEFGVKLERIARQSGFSEWKTVAGGSSDTYIWAENGIESVNLSAGYQFEHTEDEQLDVEACYGTYKFLMEILNHTRQLANKGRRIIRVS